MLVVSLWRCAQLSKQALVSFTAGRYPWRMQSLSWYHSGSSSYVMRPCWFLPFVLTIVAGEGFPLAVAILNQYVVQIGYFCNWRLMLFGPRFHCWYLVMMHVATVNHPEIWRDLLLDMREETAGISGTRWWRWSGRTISVSSLRSVVGLPVLRHRHFPCSQPCCQKGF